MKNTTHPDRLSNWFSHVAYRVHPWLGHIYDNHFQFFNDGLVELICLLIANLFTFFLSFHFIGLWLVLLLICIATPITFGIKYLLHKYWVWTHNERF